MWHWIKRFLLGLLALALLAVAGAYIFLRSSLAQLDGDVHAAGMVGSVTVARDDYGVPLISGNDRNDVAYATGYVHAQERFFQMDLLRRSSSGELAELFGAKALPLDQSHRLHRFRARAEQLLAVLPAPERVLLDRYVAGVNDGLNALTARPFEYALVGAKPRPWSAADSLLVVWSMYFDLQGAQENRELVRGWIRDHSTPEQTAFLLPQFSKQDVLLDAPGIDTPPVPIPASPPAWWGKASELQRIVMTEAPLALGSNNWALAGSRSNNGAAIVSDDMHLGISLPNTWYRVALQFKDASGQQRRLVGVTLPGAPPAMVVGSNGHVAWGFTNSYGDYMDLVQVGPADTVAQSEEIILVKGSAPVRMVVRETRAGPLRDVAGKTYALHWVAHTPAALNMNVFKLETADTVDLALPIAASMGIPSQNFVVGDTQGNIAWTIAGPMVQRAAGSAFDATFPLAPGAPAQWTSVLEPAAHPRLLNPANGQLSSANSRQLAGEGADLIGDGGFDLGARNRQVQENLSGLGKRSDVRSVYNITLDDRALFMTAWRDRALAVLDAQAVKDKPQRAEFLRLLQTGWDGHASTSSVGYRLARGTMWAMGGLLFGGIDNAVKDIGDRANFSSANRRWPAVLARLLDEQPEAWLPAGYKDWRAVQLASIDSVIEELTRDGKPLSSASWGQRNTATIGHPIGNAVPLLKSWLSAPPDQLAGDDHMPRVAGPKTGQSERLTVAPGHEQEGLFTMPGGQSGHPLSPYFLSGHAEWVAGRALPLLPGPARHVLTFSR